MNYKEYDKAIDSLIVAIKQKNEWFDNIFAVPRGGYYPAIRIAQEFKKPIVTEIGKNTLIVDDLCDTGKTMEKYSENKTAVVFLKERSKFKPTYFGVGKLGNDWLVFPDEHEATIEENIKRIFEYIGEDPNREGLVGTPDRMIRMFKEIFRGYDPKQAPKITTFRNGADGIVYDDMVIDKGDFYSLCEHHARTFFGEYYFAYIPNPKGKILGISKIGRVVDYCAAKLQIQERLVHDIVTMLNNALGEENPPLGMALVMKGRHMCKESRGSRKKGEMVSSYLTGLFKEDDALRAEFMAIVNK